MQRSCNGPAPTFPGAGVPSVRGFVAPLGRGPDGAGAGFRYVWETVKPPPRKGGGLPNAQAGPKPSRYAQRLQRVVSARARLPTAWRSKSRGARHPDRPLRSAASHKAARCRPRSQSAVVVETQFPLRRTSVSSESASPPRASMPMSALVSAVG